MNTSTRLFTLTLTVASLLATAAAHAQTVITSLPYNITSSGLYVLNSNLNISQAVSPLISVSASNVTIDFQGHYIAGLVGNTSQNTYGVYANEESNITIKNGTIAYCYLGISLVGNGSASTNSVGHQVDNMRLTYCYKFGIYTQSSPATRITNCQLSQIGYSGAANAYGVYNVGGGTTVSDCVVSTVTATTSYGINVALGSFARRNTVSNCTNGIFGGKYEDNLTANCTTAYSGGTDAGGNN